MNSKLLSVEEFEESYPSDYESPSDYTNTKVRR